ncbi:MAG: MCE family protein [Proteobacteria bacterium]|nr:MAG: MCE family protein [Pseudomonadota bacterium]QKK12471.1 MAG: MCE family protein [Pseudomonadota bacterium]
MTETSTQVNQKRLVGLLILATVMALFYLIYLLREQAIPFANRYVVHSIVSRADTIRVGTPVTLAGISVGSVNALEITPDNQIRVVMSIEDKYFSKIREDSRATLINPTFGNPYIDIAIGTSEKTAVAEGGELALTQTSGLPDLMATLPQRLEQFDKILANHVSLSARLLDPQGDLQEGLAGFNESLTQFSQLARSLSRTEDEFHRSLANLEQITSNSAEVVKRVVATQGELNRILGSVAVTLERLETSTAQFPEHAIDFAQILRDLKEVSSQLRTATPQLTDVVQEGRNVLYEADRTLRASQKNFLIAPNLPKTSGELLIRPLRDPGLGADATGTRR